MVLVRTYVCMFMNVFSLKCICSIPTNEQDIRCICMCISLSLSVRVHVLYVRLAFTRCNTFHSHLCHCLLCIRNDEYFDLLLKV